MIGTHQRRTPIHTRRTFRPALLGAAAALALTACASGGGDPPPAAVAPASPSSAETVQPALRPGDAVLLKVYREKDLSDTLRVDENGDLTLPLLGTRSVAGVPADSLKRQLMQAYREYIRRPAIEIRILRRISVLGEVRQPGLYPVDPTYSLTDALALAGGPTGAADRDDIRLLRDGEVLRTGLQEARTLAETPLRSGDQIVVGRKSWFSRNWQWLAGTVVSGSLILITR